MLMIGSVGRAGIAGSGSVNPSNGKSTSTSIPGIDMLMIGRLGRAGIAGSGSVKPNNAMSKLQALIRLKQKH